MLEIRLKILNQIFDSSYSILTANLKTIADEIEYRTKKFLEKWKVSRNPLTSELHII